MQEDYKSVILNNDAEPRNRSLIDSFCWSKTQGISGMEFTYSDITEANKDVETCSIG